MKNFLGMRFPLILLAFVALVAAPASQAIVLGELWQNVPTSGANAAIVPAGAPDAMFNPVAIDYNSTIGGYTPVGFLNHPAFFNTSASFDPNASFNNTFIRFTGQLFLNAGDNSFVVPHDDGLTLFINGIGLVVDQPGPTSPVSTPFIVTAATAGLFDFTLQYGECCGPPAVLGLDINGQTVGNPTPEPISLALLGIGLGGLWLRRSRAR